MVAGAPGVARDEEEAMPAGTACLPWTMSGGRRVAETAAGGGMAAVGAAVAAAGAAGAAMATGIAAKGSEAGPSKLAERLRRSSLFMAESRRDREASDTKLDRRILTIFSLRYNKRLYTRCTGCYNRIRISTNHAERGDDGVCALESRG